MPIKRDDAFKSIKFDCVNERDEAYELQLEFHQTEEFGPTISINNFFEDGSALSLPASVYADAVDYLRGEGALEGGAPKQAAPVASRAPAARLQPTRVAGQQPVSRPAQQPAARTATRPAAVQQKEQEILVSQTGYAPQHTVLQQTGMVEPQTAEPQQNNLQPRQGQKVSTNDQLVKQAEQLEMTDTEILTPTGEPTAVDPSLVPKTPAPQDDQQALDPEFSLANAKAKKAAGPGRKGIKPFGHKRETPELPPAGGQSE